MITALSTYARAGALALGVLTGVSGSAMAAPIGPIDRPQPPSAATALPVVPVAEGELRGRFGGQAAVNDYWRRGGNREWRGNRGGNREWRGNRGWREGRREWRRDREWRGNRHWRGDRGWREGRREWRHDRRWDRRWNRRDYYRDRYRSGIYLGFGVPYYGGYGDPGYYVAPRPRYYAPAGTNAHTRWCYNRYRSYRAWDNTYQPYGGPRRQCVSPYV